MSSDPERDVSSDSELSESEGSGGEEVRTDEIEFRAGCGKTQGGEDIEDIVMLDGTRKRPPIVPVWYPYTVRLEEGKTYKWCSCGRSKKQPWCDNTHKKTDPQPIRYKATKTAGKWQLICGCKYTSTPPWCDGSHIHPEYGYEEPEYKQQMEEKRKKRAAEEAAAKAAGEAGTAVAESAQKPAEPKPAFVYVDATSMAAAPRAAKPTAPASTDASGTAQKTEGSAAPYNVYVDATALAARGKSKT